MDIGFHYTDTPPQEYLDQLHQIDVPRLFDPNLNKTQRKNFLVRTKDQFKQWKDDLRTQIKAIDERYGKENKQKAALVKAPYETLDRLGTDLNKAIMELERAVQSGRLVPEGFGFGTVIYGDLERGEWHLGELEDERRWDAYTTIRNRLDHVIAERNPMMRDMKLNQARIKELQGDIKKMMKTHKSRTNTRKLLLRLLPIIIVVAICLLSGWMIVQAPEPVAGMMSNQLLGGLLFIIGTAGAVLMIVLERRRKQHVAELKQDISAGKKRLKQLKVSGKKARMDFYPTNELYKELKADFEALKTTFG